MEIELNNLTNTSVSLFKADSTLLTAGGAVVSTITSQLKGSGFEPAGRLGHFCVEFTSSALAPWVSSGFLPQPKDRLI